MGLGPLLGAPAADPAWPECAARLELRLMSDLDQEIGDLLRQVRHHLALDQELGLQAMPRQLPESKPSQVVTKVDQSPVEYPDAAQPVDHQLNQLAAKIADCQRCGLCRGRSNTVPGESPANPALLHR